MECYDFRKLLQNQCKTDPSQTILVGVSGGADSLCLLHRLYENGCPVIAAHFNHQLRQSADSDEAYVQKLAKELNIPFVSGRGDVREVARQNNYSIEEAARNLRYRFLIEQAQALRIEVVAVGHTADDQVETMLMHLLRGSGTDGLRGMPWTSEMSEWGSSIRLIRPLLGTWRRETEAYCRDHGWTYLLDATNTDPAYYRNRIRLELIPTLETYNPQARELLWRTSQVVSGDHEVMEAGLSALWDRVYLASDENSITLRRTETLGFTAGQQRAVLRKAVKHLVPSLRDIGYELIESIRAYLMQPGETHQKSLAGGIWLYLEAGRFYLTRDVEALPTCAWPQVNETRELDVSADGAVELADGWRMVWERTETAPVPREDSPRHAWMDADLIQPPVILGGWTAGDRFSPLGMNGNSIKVSDFFTNIKVPKRVRTRWPLLRDKNGILWAAGCRACEQTKITPASSRFIHFILEEPS
jgi:tRNA(Ile)-lysidine synthase